MTRTLLPHNAAKPYAGHCGRRSGRSNMAVFVASVMMLFIVVAVVFIKLLDDKD